MHAWVAGFLRVGDMEDNGEMAEIELEGEERRDEDEVIGEFDWRVEPTKGGQVFTFNVLKIVSDGDVCGKRLSGVHLDTQSSETPSCSSCSNGIDSEQGGKERLVLMDGGGGSGSGSGGDGDMLGRERQEWCSDKWWW
ncbi:hypothetical protein ACH5RR_039097 [Cinchona calisaya]|uniref:Uncharacterized protein n=1 Tax=Cinchona calisaya TaxID=153742 RepID=A0ABD2Y0Q1_9GENT